MPIILPRKPPVYNAHCSTKKSLTSVHPPHSSLKHSQLASQKASSVVVRKSGDIHVRLFNIAEGGDTFVDTLDVEMYALAGSFLPAGPQTFLDMPARYL